MSKTPLVMRQSFLKLKTNTWLKKNDSIRVSLPYKQALSVGVIFTVEDRTKHDEIKELVKKLELDGKQVKVMSFLPKNKDNYEFMFDFFTEKDLSFWGAITSPVATRFADAPFDFLFYLDITPNPLILNLIARSKSRCRIGRFWEKAHPFFELMIESQGDTKSLIDSAYKYTRLLK